MNRPSFRFLTAIFSITIIAAAIWIIVLSRIRSDSNDDEMIYIPEGDFIMGSDREDREGKTAEFGFSKPLYLDEHPRQTISLPSYFIDRYEVTQGQYAQFVIATGGPSPKHWVEGHPPPGKDRLPVTGVNWYDAQSYCTWRGKRLPTETEWEKAARGTDGREFPWGNEYDGKKANTADAGRGGLAEVGSFPEGRSPYGVEDMIGNAWEWTMDWYLPYPNSMYQSDLFGRKFKVLKGGSWGGTSGHYFLSEFYRIPYRYLMPPDVRFADFGFRCVKSTPTPD